MNAMLLRMPALDMDVQVALLLIVLLLLGLLAVRIVNRPKPALRLIVQHHSAKGLTVAAIARELALSQDAVRLLLSAPMTRKFEPSGRNYRPDRQPMPQGSRRVELGNRCDVSA